MTSLGLMELLLIGVVLLIAVGPERLPKVTRDVGRMYGRMRRAADDLRRSLVLEADRMDEEDRLRELRQRRVEAEGRREQARTSNPAGPQAQPPPDTPPRREPSQEEEASPPEIPPGFTPEDWAELPTHIRERIQRRRGTG